ncbi:MAG: hypothetical protein ACXABV_15445 [Candidatus Thorarchaeota archaeon]|jgi:energy-coupling factor transport system substrate-specific component
MTEEETTESIEPTKQSLREKLQVQSSDVALRMLASSILGAILFLLLEMIPWPYMAVGLFPLGFIPALAVVATVGAMKGPLAGFLTGYLGTLVSDIVLNGAIAVFTLYGAAIGVLGFIVGLASYDLARGRYLAKLSIMSLIGLVFTALLTVVIGLFVERIASLAAIGFQLLPMLTKGIPTVILLTPLFARIWQFITSSPAEESEPSE